MRQQSLRITEEESLVLFVIRYSAIFKFALNIDEIFNRLPRTSDLNSLFFKLPIKRFSQVLTKRKTQQRINSLLNKGLLENTENYYFLNRKHFLSRKVLEKHIFEKDLHVVSFINLAKKIPWIKAVILTGSTAVANANKNDDLDFLIICRHNSLWITRFVLLLLSQLNGKRPHLDNNQSSAANDRNAWCFNLWLDESDLQIDDGRQSIYEAYEILQMRWLYDPEKIEDQFLSCNTWVKNYLQFFHRRKFINRKIKRNSIVSFILLPINLFFFLTQISYRQLFHPKENFDLSLSQAYFSEKNFREIIWQKLK